MRSPLPAVAMLALAARGAFAHAADEVIVTFDEGSQTQTMTMTADTLAMLAPIDADGDGELTQGDLDARKDAIRAGVWEQAKLLPCARLDEAATLEPGFVALRARYDCPEGELTQEFRWLLVLPPTYRVIFGNQIAKGDTRTVHLVRAPSRAPPGAPSWVSRLVVGLVGGVLATLVGFWLVRRWWR